MYRHLLYLFPTGMSCNSWQRRGAFIAIATAPLLSSSSPRSPFYPLSSSVGCLFFAFYPSTSFITCHHDNLSPAPAGEEHRAQLFRSRDQGSKNELRSPQVSLMCSSFVALDFQETPPKLSLMRHQIKTHQNKALSLSYLLLYKYALAYNLSLVYDSWWKQHYMHEAHNEHHCSSAGDVWA